MESPKTRITLISCFITTFLAAYAYVLMEWLFFITKPSFLSIYSFIEKFEILLFAGAFLAGVGYIFTFPILAISLVPGINKIQKPLISLSCLVPAAIMASLLILWLDNFTYILFGFGIVSTDGFTRGLYGVLFLVLLGISFVGILRFLSNPPKFITNLKSRRIIVILIGVTYLISSVLMATRSNFVDQENIITNGRDFNNRPNILIITSDGLNADNMSVYGYERDTTPQIRKLSETSLIAENAFSNAGNTTGSLISIYTGKYATKTRVIYPPDILRGSDSYQHLPGILRSIGYYNVEITVPHYGDAYTLNLLEGFDIANNQKNIKSNILPIINKYSPNGFFYFLFETGNRLFDRITHIFYIKKMVNPYDLVTKPPSYPVDQEKLKKLFDVIRQTDAPLFIHLHLMGTHGEFFYLGTRVFSTEETKDIPWNTDAYDDSILEFDANIGIVLDKLIKRNLLDKTILIIGSDHGQQFQTTVRIPLIIRFPNGEYAGKLKENVQNLDIAPTLLDYLNLEKPEWMQGQSFLKEPPALRPIFSSSVSSGEKKNMVKKIIDQSKIKPPFYQFSNISLVYCQKWYELDLVNTGWKTGNVEGHTTPCSDDRLLSDEQALGMIIDHLQENGFDTSSLANLFQNK